MPNMLENNAATAADRTFVVSFENYNYVFML